MSDIQAVLQDLQAVAEAQMYVDKLTHSHLDHAYGKVRALSQEHDILIRKIVSELQHVKKSNDIANLIRKLQQHSTGLAHRQRQPAKARFDNDETFFEAASDENIYHGGVAGQENSSDYSTSDSEESDSEESVGKAKNSGGRGRPLEAGSDDETTSEEGSDEE